MRFARLLTFCGSLSLLACEGQTGDPPKPSPVPNPAGKDLRIHEIRDPESPTKAAHESTVSVSGAVVIAVDRYDETGNGRSAGTIYVQDLGSQEPYSGISLFNPSFIPGNLRVGPGDALDLRGEYQENQDLPISFAKGAFLVQISNAIGTFRFDADVPAPATKSGNRDLKIEDFATYESGRKWLNMLVTLKNVTVVGEKFPKDARVGKDRISYDLLARDPNADNGCTAPFPKAPTLVNELTELPELAPGTVIKSLTGVVTFFCNLHIAPRDAKDIVL